MQIIVLKLVTGEHDIHLIWEDQIRKYFGDMYCEVKVEKYRYLDRGRLWY
jgi:hypothetical protein